MNKSVHGKQYTYCITMLKMLFCIQNDINVVELDVVFAHGYRMSTISFRFCSILTHTLISYPYNIFYYDNDDRICRLF